MNPVIAAILKRHDAGESDVAVIAEAEKVTAGYVYGILREHRPDRPRKQRTRTSEKRKLILGLLAQGVAPRRTAFLARCTPAYVYQLMDQEAAA